MSPASFSARLLAWFDREGRKDLPWQTPPDPYRIRGRSDGARLSIIHTYNHNRT